MQQRQDFAGRPAEAGINKVAAWVYLFCVDQRVDVGNEDGAMKRVII